MPRKWWLVLLVLCLCPAPAMALDPAKRISQYVPAWRIQDGLFKGSRCDIVETRDGYLWVGTTSGLRRFDSVRFVPRRAEHGAQLRSSDVRAFLAARDGSLRIAPCEAMAAIGRKTLSVR